MPVSRSSQRRRRSSLGIAASLSPIKPGNYGITTSPRNVTFAPNVTPGTFVEDAEGNDDLTTEVPSPSDALFPPADAPSAAPTRRRQPPGKRRSQGYIPRPPNAFMLFRANFVRQRHVPGSIETNHGSLSKIIGNCWKALPDAEKKVWEARAKKAKAEHKEMYPNYRFRPVHNKNKKKEKKEKPLDEPDERRCEEVAQLLLEGKKGDELLAAVRRLDLDRQLPASSSASPMPAPYPQLAMPAPTYPLYLHQRRSSSAPPGPFHGPIAVPSMQDFFPSHPSSRAATPVSNIARAYRDVRRPSSAGPSYYMDWTMPSAPVTLDSLQPDHEPLPDVNTQFFQPFTGMPVFEGSPFAPAAAPAYQAPHQGNAAANASLAVSIGPFDADAVDPLSTALSPDSSTLSSAYPYSAITPVSGMQWLAQDGAPTPSAGSPSHFSATPPPPPEFDAHGDMGMMYAPAPEQLGWAPHDGALAAQDPAGAYAQTGFVDQDGVPMQEYVYGVEQYAAGAPPCGMEADGFHYPDEMQYHHPVEISQY